MRKVVQSSKAKRAHIIHIRHRDEVEPPITDWLREAYDLPDKLAAAGLKRRPAAKRKPSPRRNTKKR